MGCVEDGCDKQAEGITSYCKEHWLENWHGWYAWFPVLTLEGQWAWFSTVIRKRCVNLNTAASPPWWQPTFWYRTPEFW